MHHQLFTKWLHKAHALEVHLIEVLEAHAKQAADHPEAAAKIKEHLEHTRRHAETVKGMLAGMNEDTAVIKDTLGSLSGMIMGASSALMDDNLVKNTISDYAAEHLEIALYQALIAAAPETGHEHLVEGLQSILKDEQEMAAWLSDHLPQTVREVVAQAMTEGE